MSVTFEGAELEGKMYLEGPARELSATLGLPIILMNWHGRWRSWSPLDPDIFYIFFWAKPTVERYERNSCWIGKAFDIALGPGQGDSAVYTGDELKGIDILDTHTTELLARRVGNALFVRFDLPHRDHPDTGKIFRFLLDAINEQNPSCTLNSIKLNLRTEAIKREAAIEIKCLEAHMKTLDDQRELRRVQISRSTELTGCCLAVTDSAIALAIAQLKEHKGIYALTEGMASISIETRPVYIEHEGITYKLGRVKFTLSWGYPFLAFTPKTTPGPNVHPHVDKSGIPCMEAGMLHWIKCALVHLDLVLAMDAIWTFLHTYTLGDAHTRIEAWPKKDVTE